MCWKLSGRGLPLRSLSELQTMYLSAYQKIFINRLIGPQIPRFRNRAHKSLFQTHSRLGPAQWLALPGCPNQGHRSCLGFLAFFPSPLLSTYQIQMSYFCFLYIDLHLHVKSFEILQWFFFIAFKIKFTLLRPAYNKPLAIPAHVCAHAHTYIDTHFQNGNVVAYLWSWANTFLSWNAQLSQFYLHHLAKNYPPSGFNLNITFPSRVSGILIWLPPQHSVMASSASPLPYHLGDCI